MTTMIDHLKNGVPITVTHNGDKVRDRTGGWKWFGIIDFIPTQETNTPDFWRDTFIHYDEKYYDLTINFNASYNTFSQNWNFPRIAKQLVFLNQVLNHPVSEIEVSLECTPTKWPVGSPTICAWVVYR